MRWRLLGPWWLTVLDFATTCARCSRRTGAGGHVIYSHVARRSLCTSCMDFVGIPAQPSRRLLAAEGRRPTGRWRW